MLLTDFRDEVDVLERVTVRLLHEAERPAFDGLLEEKHYLEDSTLVGQALRYVAELNGRCRCPRPRPTYPLAGGHRPGSIPGRDVTGRTKSPGG